MLIARIKAKGQVTIPYEILKELDIKEGDFLEVKVESRKIGCRNIVLIPKVIVNDNRMKVKKERRGKEK